MRIKKKNIYLTAELTAIKKKIENEIENEIILADVLVTKVKKASELITFCQTKLKSPQEEVGRIISKMENPNSCVKKAQ